MCGIKTNVFNRIDGFFHITTLSKKPNAKNITKLVGFKYLARGLLK